MPEAQQSFIPVARRQSFIQSPANALALTSGPVDGAAPSSPKIAHRRNLSLALSSDGEGRRSPLTARRVSKTHSRLASAIEDIQLAALSPESITLSLDGTDITDDDYSPADAVDRIRAPTRSSMNKQKKATPKNTPKKGRRRSMIPATTQPDERLGLSRIPRASVTHALSLHASTDGSHALLPHADGGPSTGGGGMNMSMNGSEVGSPLVPTDSLSPSTEPARLRDPLSPVVVQNTSRIPSGPHGKSTRMITTLQTELEHTKSHLDRVKQEVRNCRREIGTLTRRSEDLRETRDRQRGEMEALQNVISRKERMITEVLARARTAEASVTQNATDKKDLESRVKKAEADARAEIEAATAARQKAESECDALRDSVRSLREAWTREVVGYKEEVERVQSQMRDERDAAAKKHDAIMTVVKEQSVEHKNVVALVAEVKTQNEAARGSFDAQISSLRAHAQRSARDSEDARNLAKSLAGELARLRRFARLPPREDLDAIINAESGSDLTATPSYPSPADTPAPAPSSKDEDGTQSSAPTPPKPAPAELTSNIAQDAEPTTPPDQE